MAAQIHELFTSRHSDASRDAQSFTLEFFLRDVPEDSENEDTNARALVIATAPLSFYGLLLDNIQMTPLGGGCWTSSVNYSSYVPVQNPEAGVNPAPSPPVPAPPPPPPAPTAFEPLPSGFSFDITGVDEKRTQSIRTRSKTKAGGGAAADNKGAIGVTVDGEVEGCQTLMPKFEWSVTRTFAYVTPTYLQVLNSLVGTLNAAVFYTWPIDSTLFIGASGSVQNNGPVNITFKFQTGRHEPALEIADNLTVPLKKAHDYLWVSYKNSPDANKLMMIPDAAYVEVVYLSDDFSQLKIGT